MISAIKLDEIDAKILKCLLIDGRKRLTEIAEEACVSKDIIWEHYKNMKKNGIIVGSTVQLNYESLGYNLSASFFIYNRPKAQHQVIEGLRKITGLYDAYRWGSPSCIWAVSDMMRVDQLEHIRESILKLPSVLRLEVEVWTGNRNMPENLSVLGNNKISCDIEKAETLEKNRIDEVDRQLIDKLAANSRASFNKISKEMGIATSTAIRRYNNLKLKGIIRAVIQINPIKIGYPISACFRLKTDSQWELDSIANKITEVPDVIGIQKTAGVHDLTIFTEMKNIEHLFILENRIAKIDGIKEMKTSSLNQFPVLPYPREHISSF